MEVVSPEPVRGASRLLRKWPAATLERNPPTGRRVGLTAGTWSTLAGCRFLGASPYYGTVVLGTKLYSSGVQQPTRSTTVASDPQHAVYAGLSRAEQGRGGSSHRGGGAAPFAFERSTRKDLLSSSSAMPHTCHIPRSLMVSHGHGDAITRLITLTAVAAAHQITQPIFQAGAAVRFPSPGPLKTQTGRLCAWSSRQYRRGR